jgi:hypothetical protein
MEKGKWKMGHRMTLGRPFSSFYFPVGEKKRGAGAGACPSRVN